MASPKTYTRSWRTALYHAIDSAHRVAVVGIGHELHGDDAVGVSIARRLLGGARQPDWLVIDAGPVPERCAGPLRQFQPDLVILIDAAYMGAPPGEIRWFDRCCAHDSGLGTHGLSLDLVAAYLEAELRCRVGLIGVQPAAVAVDTPLSVPARAAVRRVVSALHSCPFTARQRLATRSRTQTK